ncbi:type I DNA topoisomerase [Pedobacter arcticus]|uniref:type I DNA topoisomerase n=1 Tax=Pedobacter arcticus TaxID=752140 RepID=UPI0002DF7EE9|nr:type I DNA topoisomerase [Pedobacter arcticus]
MAKNLLIVESPAKAKTIEGYLGKDFLVKSSYGHIRDLKKDDSAIEVNNGFKQHYEISPDKKALVAELKKLAKSAEMVWLASDEDREGEAISWHLFESLGLKEENTKRIVFHEITKPAILKAIENPRQINYNLVNAQQARRVLDRLVGFELSPVLWKKVKPSLSAGRVQSVAVRLIVDREREVNAFESTAAYRVVAVFSTDKKELFKAELSGKFDKEADAQKFLEDCAKANFKINSLDIKPLKRNPAAPFTTSTLQQEASRKLGFSVSRTMTVAQKLYETGKITYMRTDSVNLSETAIQGAAQEIKSAYGEKYLEPRKFKTKSAGAQEAHEAIRPTHFEWHTLTDGDASEKRLYELIWKRSIASQMSEAIIEKTTAKVGISTRKEELTASGEVIKFDGFLKVYLESDDEESDAHLDEKSDNAILPPLSQGQNLNLVELNATQRFSRPPARYSEAALVKKLEELGIGRPSTYAPTISTVQNRGYVVKEERDGKKRDYQVIQLKNGEIKKQTKSEITGAEKGKLFPTDIGSVVNDFLVEHFKGIVDFHFTANVEKEFDEIAQGYKEWTTMLKNFYQPFHLEVEDTLANAERASGERFLGVDPKSGKNVYTRVGKFGPIVQIGEADDDEKTYASLLKSQSIESVKLEDALELFKLPFALNSYQDKDVSVGVGRFGPYVKWGETYISIPKNENALEVDQKRAQEIIDEKIIADAPVASFQGEPVTKGRGRFGPFLKWKDLFINVPVRYDFENLSKAEIDELISAKVEKEANRYIQQWEKEKIAIENGRWGPFIRFGKLMLKLSKNPTTGEKYTPEDLKQVSFDDVKKLITDQIPDAFEAKAKKAPAKKKAVAKKVVAKKK